MYFPFECFPLGLGFPKHGDLGLPRSNRVSDGRCMTQANGLGMQGMFPLHIIGLFMKSC